MKVGKLDLWPNLDLAKFGYRSNIAFALATLTPSILIPENLRTV
jgi:hypothetical protein